jgi:hypothetical protein
MPRVRIEPGRFVASAKSHVWCATFNNATVDDIPIIEAGLPRINRKVRARWMVVGVEHGPLRPSGWTQEPSQAGMDSNADGDGRSGQTPHLQVALQTDRVTTWHSMADWAKNYLSTPGHVEPANGSLDDQRRYCTKESTLGEYGDAEPFDAARAPNPGKRNDLDAVKQLIDAGVPWEEIVNQNFGTVASHERFLLAYRGEVLEREIRSQLADEYNAITWRPWQQAILNICNGPVQNRKVHAVVDTSGNTGKSYLAKYMMIMKGALTLDAVSKRDMAYIFLQKIDSGHSVPIVCIDIARSIVGSGLQEHLPNTAMTAVWNFVESLHNGSIVNTKYESKVRVFAQPHVFIFTNHPIDVNEYTLSRDRWHIMNLNAGVLQDYNPHRWD